MKRGAAASLVLVLTLLAAVLPAAERDGLRILYLFPAPCRDCGGVEPVVREVSREFPLLGLAFGEDSPGAMPFDVRPGGGQEASAYGFTGAPLFAVTRGGSLIQTFSGEADMKDAPPILRAFRDGALSVSEWLEKQPAGKCRITGWVVGSGEYFRGARFFLTDRKQSVAIRPWLPLEAVKAPFRTARPRLMSDVINQPVVLEGKAAVGREGLQFLVERELTSD